MKVRKQNSLRAGRKLPALVAVGSGMAAMPAAALELGELTVQSTLGQPLRASIAYALAPNEVVNGSCVSVAQSPANGLPGIGRATVNIADGVIALTGQTVLREPLVSARIVVNCPYTPKLSREYMLFIDPPSFEPAATESRVAETSPSRPIAEPTIAAKPAPAPRNARPTQRVNTDIAIGDRHQVAFGETLSEIASRIDNRKLALWPTVNALLEANPDAFIDNDPNKLKAGSWLTIPASVGGQVLADHAAPLAAPVSETVAAEAEPADVVAATPADPVAIEAEVIADVTAPVTFEPPIIDAYPNTAPADATTELTPGDVVISDNPFVEPVTPTEAATPVVATATDETTPSWFWWLAGLGMVFVAAIVLFGRNARRRLSGTPAPYQADLAEQQKTDTQTVQTVEMPSAIVVDESYDIADNSPTQENLTLDADLVTGSGLGDGADMDLAQDFGFAGTTELDVELPFEPEASTGADDSDDTDILPPLHTDDIASILENEVLPESDEEDDDYDMSVVVDATKMPQPEDVTEHDLKAIEVSPEEDTQIVENYTISQEIDYQILEQDYEDELTATQALNEEIARAAAELAKDTGAADNDIDESGATEALPMASVTELEVTAQMSAANNDEVVELESTVDMPVDEDDEETARLHIETGKLG